MLPPEIAKRVPKGRLMSEVRKFPNWTQDLCFLILFKRLNFIRLRMQAEWRGLGVQQSRGWVSYFHMAFPPCTFPPKRSVLLPSISHSFNFLISRTGTLRYSPPRTPYSLIPTPQGLWHEPCPCSCPNAYCRSSSHGAVKFLKALGWEKFSWNRAGPTLYVT